MKIRRRILQSAIVVLASAMIYRLAAENSASSDGGINLSTSGCGIKLEVPDYLCRNTDDDQQVSSEYYEKWDLDHDPSPGDDDLKAVTITGTAGPYGGEMTLEIPEGGGGEKINYIFWKDGEKEDEQTELSWSVPANSSRMETLYIEGYENSDAPKDVKFKATMICFNEDGSSGSPKTATGETTVYEADLDVDSDSNQLATYTVGTDGEDRIEASEKSDGAWPKRPGKIIMVNDGFGDDIPDWADGFDSASNTTQDSVCGPPVTFIPIILERKGPFTDKCKVKFTYSASDPALVSTVPGVGSPTYNFLFTKPSGTHLRIWKKNNDGTMRDKLSVISDGDYVQDNVEIPWSKLSDGTVAHLWIEAVSPSGGVGDLNVKAEITEDNVKASDNLNVTAVKMTAEPIDKRPDSGFYPINPSGVVSGEPGKFEIEVLPSDFPDAEIRWIRAAGAGTVTPETGRSVRMDNALNSTIGMFAHVFGEYYNELPRFRVETYSEYHNVDVHAYVVSGIPVGSTTRVPADSGISLSAVISKLNESHKQLGVRYTLASVEYLDSSFDQYFNCTIAQGQTLVDRTTTSGGIEMYVVDDSFNSGTGNRDYAGVNYPDRGLIVKTSGYSADSVGLITAHEIGHEGGLEDIYYTKTDEGNTMTFGMYRAFETWNVQDWPASSNFASDPSYYTRMDGLFGMEPTTQNDLMRKQVMFGVAIGGNIDFASGRVRGVGGGYGSSDPLSIRDGKVGIMDFDKGLLIHH